MAAKVCDIGHIDEIDVWYLDITDEKAKNKNSVRRLPITEPLIRLGFLRYVDHFRSLRAEYFSRTGTGHVRQPSATGPSAKAAGSGAI